MALPGVKATLLDRMYNLGRTDLPGGPVLAIIAKRGLKPAGSVGDLDAYFATSELDVINQFGEGSYLHRGYVEASTAGAPLIALIPLPTDAAFNQTTGSITSASYAAAGGGNVFDAAFAAAESIRADIIVPWGAGSDFAEWTDFNQATPPATPATPTGGANLDYFYADNTGTTGSSWAKKVADKCAQITADSYPCFAVIGMKGFGGNEFATTSQVATWFTGITTGGSPNLTSKETLNTGHFVTIVATEFRPISYPSSWGWANGAATYAAAAARIEPWRALTGKPVYNVDTVRWLPSRTQSQTLDDMGVVTAATDFGGSLKWVDATTFAKKDSDFVRLTTLRVAFDTVKAVIRVGDRYKGEPMSTGSQNSFRTEIDSRLNAMIKVGALNAADSRVSFDAAANKALVDIAISPAFELREIVLTVAINFG